MTKCVCCKTNEVGKSGVMCENCWHWITEVMTMTDIAVVVSGIHHREPDNEYAKRTCEMFVGTNYSKGEKK